MKKSIKCKKCSFENLPGAKFCQGCGEKLPRKMDFKTLVDRLYLKDIAGAGARGVSVAPWRGALWKIRPRKRSEKFQKPAAR